MSNSTSINTLKGLLAVIICTLAMVQYSHAQGNVGVGTTTPDASAILDVSATDKGVLIPRADTGLISSPATGLMTYQPSDNTFYYYNGTHWSSLGKGVVDSDGDTRIEAINDAGTVDSIRFLIDGQETMVLKRNPGGDQVMELRSAKFNTFVGENSGASLISGQFNTGFGLNALRDIETGNFNTGVGYLALAKTINGVFNTAIGEFSLAFNTSGRYNTALGGNAMTLNSEGTYNTAAGFGALHDNTTGSHNVAIGTRALNENTVRSHLVAVGDSALYNNGLNSPAPDNGIENTAIGSRSLFQNTSGKRNTALGYQALKSNTTGVLNTAVGWGALDGGSSGNLSSGSSNTAIGADAMRLQTTGGSNIAIGTGAFYGNTTGSGNIAIGWRAGSQNETGSGNIFLGTQAGQLEMGSNKLYIANSNADPDTALIYGEFDKQILRSNANVEVRSPNSGVHAVESVVSYPSGNFSDVAGVYGENVVEDYYGYGVYGKGGYMGVRGQVVGTGNGVYYGLYGESIGSNTGANYGARLIATNASSNYALYAHAAGSGLNYAGYFDGGKVYVGDSMGIGILQPEKKLHVYSGDDPTILLQSNGVSEVSGRLSLRQSNYTGLDMYYEGASDQLRYEIFNAGASQGVLMLMDFNGNVGIGTNIHSTGLAAGHKLSVDGKIACTEVRVQPAGAWPDYVFAEEYSLRPIDELSLQIAQNHHLPGIPSAAEIEQNGIQVGEMQSKLLEKIEELTLYIIDLNEEVKDLKRENAEQAGQIKRLQSQ